MSGWPGSDVSMALRSPSGRRIDRGTTASDVARITQPTFEHVEVSNPELGTWTVELFGVDVATGGAPVTLSVYQADLPNAAPVARISTVIDGDSLVLDGTASTDADGRVVSYDWYVSTPQADTVLQGALTRVPLAAPSERTYTLVVTDDRGATDFAEIRSILVDVVPGSDVNPIKLRAKGETPVALLSTATFDATTVSPTTVRLGPASAPPRETVVRPEDVNADGRPDQVLHFATDGLGITPESTQVCVTGVLPGGETFSSCNRIRPQ